MRPFRPFCGTVSNAQLFTLPPIIRMIAPGVVTTQLSFLAPASSRQTLVAGSYARPAAEADAAHRLVRLHEMEQAVVDGDAARDGAGQHFIARNVILAEPVQR